MSPQAFPLVVFGGIESKDRTIKRDRKSLPPGKEQPHEDIIDSHDSICTLNPYDLRCIVGVRRVEDGDGPDGRLKRLLDGPPLPQTPLKGPAPTSTVPVSIVDVGRTSGDNNDDEWRYNENNSENSNTNSPEDVLITIPDGRSDILSRLSKGGTLEVLLFTILFGIFSAWFMWKRVGMKAAKERKGTNMEGEDHSVVDTERDHENTLLVVNGTSSLPIGNGTVHPIVLPSPPVMNGHADPTNDINAIVPTSTPSTPNEHKFSLPLPPQPSTPSALGIADDNEDSDVEAELENGASATATPGKRKARRGKRGKKKKPGLVLGGEEVGNGAEKEKADRDPEGGEKPSSLILTTSSPKPLATSPPSLIVSDTILGIFTLTLPLFHIKLITESLGYGSHGTVVYEGSFQGRAVAVKRLLQDFVTLATREVSILQQSDDHPNVIRYYYQESHLNFFYIALELCPASLADIIENPHGHGSGGGTGGKREEEWKDIVRGFDAKRAMRQIASGLMHLHGLGLIHRDIKPQNILISSSSSGGRGGGGYRMLISDFGLCKKLDMDQTSFLPTANGATGTVNWRAPEILRGDVKLDEPSTGDDSTSSRGSVATINGASSTKTRLTKSVDIFALGCLFYYTLTNGGHPYGDRFEREANIIKDNKQLSLISQFCSTEESTEAQDLITCMLHPQPSQRPAARTCLLHPFFWDPAKRLGFLQDASDRFEVMCRDPKDGALITLEKDAGSVVGNDWHQRLDRIFIENLGKYRKYDGKSVQDLMRALRNKVRLFSILGSFVFKFFF